MNEDDTYNVLIRTPPEEFIKKWDDKRVYLPMAYVDEFIQFIKFCKENSWDPLDGVITVSERHYTNERDKADKELKRLKSLR
jgi:hypothetical protein